MQIAKINTGSNSVTVAPLGDIQYTDADGSTATRILREHIQQMVAEDAWFIGMGDYIDFLSPSNRQRLIGAALYDTADKVVDAKAHEIVEELFETVLKPTKGRWLGLLEGHHFYEGQGSTSDMWLAEMLECAFLGTSAYLQLNPCGVVLYAHHGQGGGILPTTGLNKMYHVSAGLQGADVYLMGHNTKMGASRLSRPRPDWEKNDLTHSDVLLVNTGGFSKSNIVNHTHGRIVRGDYAEQGMMTPSPLAAPVIRCSKIGKQKRIRVEV